MSSVYNYLDSIVAFPHNYLIFTPSTYRQSSSMAKNIAWSLVTQDDRHSLGDMGWVCRAMMSAWGLHNRLHNQPELLLAQNSKQFNATWQIILSARVASSARIYMFDPKRSLTFARTLSYVWINCKWLAMSFQRAEADKKLWENKWDRMFGGDYKSEESRREGAAPIIINRCSATLSASFAMMRIISSFIKIIISFSFAMINDISSCIMMMIMFFFTKKIIIFSLFIIHN